MPSSKRNKLKIINKLLLFIISTLGFAVSCSTPHEYGSPHGKFILNTKVVSSDSSKAIGDIKVEYGTKVDYTDSSGEFSVISYGISNSYFIELKLLDVDDSLNGKFEDLDTILEFNDLNYVGGDGKWDEGTATENIILQMKREENNN